MSSPTDALAAGSDERQDATVGAARGQLLDDGGLDRVDEHAALARQRTEAREASIARSRCPDAVNRTHPRLEHRFDRDVPLHHHRPLVDRHGAAIRTVRDQVALGQVRTVVRDRVEPDLGATLVEAGSIMDR